MNPAAAHVVIGSPVDVPGENALEKTSKSSTESPGRASNVSPRKTSKHGSPVGGKARGAKRRSTVRKLSKDSEAESSVMSETVMERLDEGAEGRALLKAKAREDDEVSEILLGEVE